MGVFIVTGIAFVESTPPVTTTSDPWPRLNGTKTYALYEGALEVPSGNRIADLNGTRYGGFPRRRQARRASSEGKYRAPSTAPCGVIPSDRWQVKGEAGED